MKIAGKLRVSLSIVDERGDVYTTRQILVSDDIFQKLRSGAVPWHAYAWTMASLFKEALMAHRDERLS